MSGRAKKNFYRIFTLLFAVAAIAGAVLLAIFYVPGAKYGWREYDVASAFVLCVALRVPAAVHELGHLLFGKCAGMKCASVTLCYLRFDADGVHFAGNSYAGAVAAFPKNGRRVRAKLIAFTLGGIAINLALGGGLLALCLALPYHPALFFCGLLSVFLLFEGIAALLPADLPEGKTDGAVLLGLLKGAPEEEILLRVTAAQGILYCGDFTEIKKELLFEAPVVREDLPAFGALRILRAQYLLAEWEEDGAKAILERLCGSSETDRETLKSAARYLDYFRGAFRAEKSGFAGIDHLEGALAAAQEKKFSAADTAE